MSLYRLAGKRALDVAGAAIGLVLFSPLLIVTAVIIWATLGSPLFFRQERPGKGGKPFRILKFRTMREAAGPGGTPLPDAERLGRVGRVIRAASIDELPELWNVLRGDMSLVGPRPLLMQYLGRYSPRQMRRHEVRPGVTGLAQAMGRNALSWEAKFELDVLYVERHSFLMDLSILARTVASVVSRRGINQEGHATAPEFMGSSKD